MPGLLVLLTNTSPEFLLGHLRTGSKMKLFEERLAIFNVNSMQVINACNVESAIIHARDVVPSPYEYLVRVDLTFMCPAFAASSTESSATNKGSSG
jgi:hypothetical protein